MFKNLFRVAMRNLKKDKGYSILNILGLTIGISFSLFLFFYVVDELGYDRYNKKADRIYRIGSYIKEPDNNPKWAVTPYPLGPALKKDYPEVEQSVRFVGNGRTLFKNGNIQFYDEKIYVVDSNLFDVFTYELVEGNPKTALLEPKSIVLTESMAKKYFGKTGSYFGKTLVNAQNEVYKVTGVIKDPPRNSHLVVNGLISNSSLPKDFANNWGGFGFFTYVLLKPNTDPKAFEKKLLALYDKYLAQIFAQFNIKIRFGVQNIRNIHLHSDLSGEPEELGSMSYIYIFSAVAIFMLTIACINYMNLTTARSARRAKEIGVRKVAGSFRSQLVLQFLIESVSIAILALLLSMGVVYLLLPVFNSLSGKSISIAEFFRWQTFGVLLLVILFVGILGGSYPAFYLSRFNPIAVLRGNLSKGSSNANLRRSLVVIQFTISIVMIICTMVVYNQLRYMRNKDLGFNKVEVMGIRIDADGNFSQKIKALKDELRKDPAVISVSTAQNAPGNNTNFNLFTIEAKKGFIDKGVDNYAIDEDFIPTLGMSIVKGRNFSSTNPADTTKSIIVNENAVKAFGWKENPLGRRIKFPGDTSGRYLEVVGVVKDFHQKSLYNPITPLFLFYNPASNVVLVKIRPAQAVSILPTAEKLWKSSFPALPFQYSFLDRDLDSQYAADQKRGKIFLAFSSLTILITCLGLLGLVAFTTEQKRKDISIHKIMGADLRHIVTLITKNFLFLVAISCLLAFPIAYYFMHKWLQIFPYNAGLKISSFAISAITVLLITLFTVSFHTIKAAFANPVNSLRTE
jgi:putative ABC transport system permease protein